MTTNLPFCVASTLGFYFFPEQGSPDGRDVLVFDSHSTLSPSSASIPVIYRVPCNSLTAVDVRESASSMSSGVMWRWVTMRIDCLPG